MTTKQPPVFVVGSVRSGTTMFRLMLDHHPQIGIFGEFEYGFALTGKDSEFPPLSVLMQHWEKDRVYLRRKHTVTPKGDSATTIKALFDELAERMGKPVCGASVHSNFHNIPAIWPDARFIHLVRDPRDVAKSCVKLGFSGTVWHGTRFWLDALERWGRLKAKVPAHHVLELRYEDVVKDVEGALRKACGLLGVEFDPRMLSYPESTTYSAPSSEYIQQWRKNPHDPEIAIIEARCRGLMPHFGYQPVTEVREVGVSDQLSLDVRDKLNRARFRIDRYGLPLYAAWQVAKRAEAIPFSDRILKRVREIDESKLK